MRKTCTKLIPLVECIVALCIVVVFPGCSDDPANPADSTPQLSAAPTEITIAGARYNLEIVLAWRDFQPISPPDGQPLIVIGRAVRLDSLPITDSLQIPRVFAVFKNEIWDTKPTGESVPGNPPFALSFVLRGGPKWGPGVNIDIIAVIEEASHRSHLLRVDDVFIERAD